MTITELQNAIDQNNEAYHNGGSPVDDAVFDKWKAELRALAPDDPRLTRVGAPVTGTKVRHQHPMGSLDNAMNEAEFMTWHEKQRISSIQEPGMPEPLYNVSYKMDGGSVALYYQDGRLERAVTRGDGVEGEDITANALRMQGVPQDVTLPAAPRQHKPTRDPIQRAANSAVDVLLPPMGLPFTGSVRGEVMLWNEDWKTLDPDQTSNPRNLGNGMTRRHSGEGSELLRFTAFRLFDAEGKPFDTQSDSHFQKQATESGMLFTLRLMGFNTVPERGRDVTAPQVCQIYRAMQGLPLDPNVDVSEIGSGSIRANLPFDIDGLVVKVESLVFQENAGESGNCPRAQVALKFPPMGSSTKVLSVDWSVGHTGALIPTANLEPVKIGGVTVSRALLCNMDEIARLGVAIGDLVMVVRRGDVIPKCQFVVDKLWECPQCGFHGTEAEQLAHHSKLAQVANKS